MPKSAKSRKLPITRSGDVAAKRRPLAGPALIRRFHVLQTALQAATRKRDAAQIHSLGEEIDGLGGLQAYQKSSIAGQDVRRGGDSSKILLSWLKSPTCAVQIPRVGEQPAKVLELGCLSAENYISQHPKQLILTRIDLNAQSAQIQQQDFLMRPLPAGDGDLFQGISCSLVLNFVPIADRGRFLLHLTAFLPPSADTNHRHWLFLVLPAPCVVNSRYMTLEILTDMLETVGFTMRESKMTDRMAYWLLERTGPVKTGKTFKKQEQRKGSNRNNFWIPLQT
ncbi:putative methyltransferase-domain-containing protein [Protomyces lactucae-debilis]|uniref:25S rRNA adenine-N(1) methyltransferase n=1 Tax=Protomyces lactucae-debilis TaxID=2754530 RepID=A0A1Y2FFC0_PROLT|nr:putative methyltransferase-domain-containing protein [Protomyces lactucae-debilis]ORY81525.1 putative methyltransferase-domain-containing protein [Protomyces lactucae-debilis]